MNLALVLMSLDLLGNDPSTAIPHHGGLRTVFLIPT